MLNKIKHNFFSHDVKKDRPFFYLKVNANSLYTINCLQQWIKVVEALQADYIIICDKPELKKRILEKVHFRKRNVKFITSKVSVLKKYIKNITTKNWEKAGYAHLTTFYHAKKHNISHFWNIDADDTFLCAIPEKIVKLLEMAQNKAINNDIALFSFDMWRSRTKGRAWTFGITYVNNTKKVVDKIKNNHDKSWQEKYKDVDNGINIDWFITYLKDNNILNIETFYTENIYFIHYGSEGLFLNNMVGCNICYWDNNYVHYPIIENIFKNDKLGKIPIANDCINFDCNYKIEKSIEFMNWLNLFWLTPQVKQLWNITDDYSEKLDNIFQSWLKEQNV